MTENIEANFEQIDMERFLDIIEATNPRRGSMLSCQHSGMTIWGLAREYAGLDEKKKPTMRAALDSLVKPPAEWGVPPLLRKERPTLVGLAAPSEAVYLLTEIGAYALNKLLPDLEIKPPQPRNQLDLTHRYLALKAFERARQDGLSPKLEHRMVCKTFEVRADVFLEEWHGMAAVVEIEQKMGRNNIPRAAAKFERWERYLRALQEEGGDRREWQMILVFNVRERELEKVAARWQEALNQVEVKAGGLSYYVTYMSARTMLMETRFDNALDLATSMRQELDPEDRQYLAGKANGDTDSITLPDRGVPDWISAETYVRFQQCMDAVQTAKPTGSLEALLELAEVIFEASFYKDSPSKEYGVFPRESIWLLREYLRHPWMYTTYHRMIGEFKNIRKRNLGVVLMRDSMTRLLWDVLLRRHGLGRGGALRVIFQIPELQDLQSDYRVEVHVDGALRNKLGYKIDKASEALSFMLGGLYLYADMLGLES